MDQEIDIIEEFFDTLGKDAKPVEYKDSHWDTHYEKGKPGVEKTLEFLWKNELPATATPELDKKEQKRGDIQVCGKYLEIKTDHFVDHSKGETYNVYIEFEEWSNNNGCWYPSGISTTESDYWITYFVHLDSFLVMKTSRLKKYIQENTCEQTENKYGTSRGYKIPKKLLIRAGVALEGLDALLLYLD